MIQSTGARLVEKLDSLCIRCKVENSENPVDKQTATNIDCDIAEEVSELELNEKG